MTGALNRAVAPPRRLPRFSRLAPRPLGAPLLLALMMLPMAATGPANAQDKAAEKPAKTTADWGPPTTAYEADMVFTNDRGRSRTARLYYTAKRQRLEFTAGKAIVAIIFDQTANKAYQLLMNDRSWRPVPAVKPQFNFGMSDPASKREKVAEERMAGMKVTKYRVTSKTSVGDVFEGFGWADENRIIVKMVGQVTRGKKTQKLTLVLQKLKIGPVDPGLFVVPKAYKKLPPLKR